MTHTPDYITGASHISSTAVTSKFQVNAIWKRYSARISEQRRAAVCMNGKLEIELIKKLK